MTGATTRSAAIMFVAAWVLGACQTDPHRNPAPESGDLAARREAVVAAVDWSKAIDLTIEMHDHGYRPRELSLKSGQPYRITLVNYGGANHYFTAPEFFAASAIRKAEVRHVAEVKGQGFTSFEIYARGGSLDLYVVPMAKGRYRAHCHMKDHERLNIEGILIVE